MRIDTEDRRSWDDETPLQDYAEWWDELMNTSLACPECGQRFSATAFVAHLRVQHQYEQEASEYAVDSMLPDLSDLPEYWRKGLTPQETLDSYNKTARP